MDEGDTGRRRVMGEDQPTTRRVKRGGTRGGETQVYGQTEGPREPGRETRESRHRRRRSLRLEKMIENLLIQTEDCPSNQNEPTTNRKGKHDHRQKGHELHTGKPRRERTT